MGTTDSWSSLASLDEPVSSAGSMKDTFLKNSRGKDAKISGVDFFYNFFQHNIIIDYLRVSQNTP